MGLIYSHRKFSNLTGDDIRYMSPEVIKHLKKQGLKESNSQDVSYNSDLFSAACILYEMITKKKAFDQESTDDIVQSIYNKTEFKITDSVFEILNPVLEKMFDLEQEKRGSSLTILTKLEGIFYSLNNFISIAIEWIEF